MVESTIEPQTIEIDKIKNGKATILVHWDIVLFKREEQTGYQYDECRMQWILPQAYPTREHVAKYLYSVEAEILEWAKGSKVNL